MENAGRGLALTHCKNAAKLSNDNISRAHFSFLFHQNSAALSHGESNVAEGRDQWHHDPPPDAQGQQFRTDRIYRQPDPAAAEPRGEDSGCAGALPASQWLSRRNAALPSSAPLPLTVEQYLRLILTSRVYEVVKETPLTHAVNISNRLECNVMLKREDLQPVFSFKLRGAYNKMAHLDQVQSFKGVIACSAGVP